MRRSTSAIRDAIRSLVTVFLTRRRFPGKATRARSPTANLEQVFCGSGRGKSCASALHGARLDHLAAEPQRFDALEERAEGLVGGEGDAERVVGHDAHHADGIEF